MNEHDASVAPRLLALGAADDEPYTAGDNAYDSNALYALLAERGQQLVAPPRACNADVRDARRNRPERLRSLDLLRGPPGVRGPGPSSSSSSPSFGRALYAGRQRIESCFAGLSRVGLNYLPMWVRGPRRVAVWVAAKIAQYLADCIRKQRLAA